MLEKKITQVDQPNSNANSRMFDEISRLNNQLVDMQREIAKKNAELVRLNELKNQFIGMASHDLRNPLGFIRNYCEILEEESLTLSDDQNEIINQIKSLNNYMINMVTDLLDISSIESGKLILNLEAVDIVAIVKKLVDFNKLIADKKNIKLNYFPSADYIVLYLDKVKIEQAITNLITNAIKYTNKNKQIFINTTLTESEVIISIHDEGQGIEKNELELLFKPFQRTSTKTTAGESSTGLGLYIVKKIVEGHNGKIWVESEPNIGSTFYLSLPQP